MRTHAHTYAHTHMIKCVCVYIPKYVEHLRYNGKYPVSSILDTGYM